MKMGEQVYFGKDIESFGNMYRSRIDGSYGR